METIKTALLRVSANPAIPFLVFYLFLVSCSENGKVDNGNKPDSLQKYNSAEVGTLDILAYEFVQIDTVLGNCNETGVYPSCIEISLVYPQILPASPPALKDSVEQLIRSYFFKEGGLQSLLRDYYGQRAAVAGDTLATGAWQVSNKLVLHRNDPEVLVIGIESYSYTGGAHGNSSVLFFNLKPETGEILTRSDVFKQNMQDSLLAIAEDKFRKKYNVQSLSWENAGYWFENNQFSLSNNFALLEEGILFLYNPYEITSYAEGSPEIVLNYSSVTPLLNTTAFIPEVPEP